MEMQNDEEVGLAILGQIASSFAKDFQSCNAYPVLGAEGAEFFVDVCSGPMVDRLIHRTIHVSFEDSQVGGYFNTITENAEETIRLPNASHLIAFLFLLSAALRAEMKVLHPLDFNGNYLPGWHEAIDIATCCTRS